MMQSWRRAIGIVICGVCFAFAFVESVAAAPSLSIQATRRDPSGTVVFAPTITDRQGALQPPLALPGEYVIITGAGFPANAAITASFNDGVKTVPLQYQDLTIGASALTQLPTTDAMGGINGAAFQLPPASQIAGKRGTVAVSVNGVITAGLVDVDLPEPNATSGDKLVVGISLAFYLIIGIIFVVLLRGLPTYPAQRIAQSSAPDRAA